MKQCIICGTIFNRPKGCGEKDWIRRKMCSKACRIINMRKSHIGFKKGHEGYLNSGSFKKGQVAWNKGEKNLSPTRPSFEKGHTPHNKGKIHSEETIAKIKLARANQINPSGKDHWNWKGGTSELRKLIQQTGLYRKWRKAVFERDDYICQFCFKRGGKLNADHKIPYSKIISENNIKTVEEAKKCLLLWDVLNGRTLCEPCHQKTDTFAGRLNNLRPSVSSE